MIDTILGHFSHINHGVYWPHSFHRMNLLEVSDWRLRLYFEEVHVSSYSIDTLYNGIAVFKTVLIDHPQQKFKLTITEENGDTHLITDMADSEQLVPLLLKYS